MKKRGSNPPLAAKIRELCETAGLTQGQLAQKSGLSGAYISQLVHAQVGKPSGETLLKLATALRVDVDILFQAAGYPREKTRMPNDPLLRAAFMRIEEELDPEDQVTIRGVIDDFVARKRREREARRNHPK